jgi:hypothetical protein
MVRQFYSDAVPVANSVDRRSDTFLHTHTPSVVAKLAFYFCTVCCRFITFVMFSERFLGMLAVEIQVEKTVRPDITS